MIMVDAGPMVSVKSAAAGSTSTISSTTTRSRSITFNMFNFKNLQYRRMLSDIARILNPDDIKTIRFICKAVDGLTKRDLELEDPLDFFVKLEERGVISYDDTDFLRELLDMVHRRDCVMLVDQYERQATNGTKGVKQVSGYYEQTVSTDAVGQLSDNFHKLPVDMPDSHKVRGPIQQPTESSMGEDLSEAFDIVVEELGRDWRQLARKLQLTEFEIDCITEDYMRNLREQCMQCLLLWKKKMRSKATKATLIEALKRCKMMYISDRLEGLQVR